MQSFQLAFLLFFAVNCNDKAFINNLIKVIKRNTDLVDLKWVLTCKQLLLYVLYVLISKNTGLTFLRILVLLLQSYNILQDMFFQQILLISILIIVNQFCRSFIQNTETLRSKANPKEYDHVLNIFAKEMFSCIHESLIRISLM